MLDPTRLTLEQVYALAFQVLRAHGVSAAQAYAIADTITAAEGDDCKSHGLFRLPGYVSSVQSGKVTPAKPATVTEKIVLTLDAKDTGPNPGDQANKFQQAIADSGYFQSALGKTNVVRLTNFGTPTPGSEGGKSYVPFTLECKYPEKTR